MELTQRGRDIRMSLYMGKNSGIRISTYEYTILRICSITIVSNMILIYMYIGVYAYIYIYINGYACIWVIYM